MENNKIKSRRIRSKGIVRKIKTTQKQDIGLDTYFHPKKKPGVNIEIRNTILVYSPKVIQIWIKTAGPNNTISIGLTV